MLLRRCRGSAGSACVNISLMRGAHTVRAPARSASSVMLARRGPCMSRGNSGRRAAVGPGRTTPRLRTNAMNLPGRAPHAHAVLGSCWRTGAGGVPLRVPSRLFLWVRPPATGRFDALFLVQFRPRRSSSQRVPAADTKKIPEAKKKEPPFKAAHRWWIHARA